MGEGHPAWYNPIVPHLRLFLAIDLPEALRTFHPHVTLARVKRTAPAARVAQFLKHNRELATAPFRAETFQLYPSELRSEGARHTLRQRFILTAAAPGAKTPA